MQNRTFFKHKISEVEKFNEKKQQQITNSMNQVKFVWIENERKKTPHNAYSWVLRKKQSNLISLQREKLRIDWRKLYTSKKTTTRFFSSLFIWLLRSCDYFQNHNQRFCVLVLLSRISISFWIHSGKKCVIFSAPEENR